MPPFASVHVCLADLLSTRTTQPEQMGSGRKPVGNKIKSLIGRAKLEVAAINGFEDR